jgi:hypothetical protein
VASRCNFPVDKYIRFGLYYLWRALVLGTGTQANGWQLFTVRVALSE